MKEIKQETAVLPNQSKVKQENTEPIKNEETIKDPPPTKNSTSCNSTTSSNKNNNFKPHDYGNTDFTKYHNRTKDVIHIAKRFQQVRWYKVLKCFHLWKMPTLCYIVNASIY